MQISIASRIDQSETVSQRFGKVAYLCFRVRWIEKQQPSQLRTDDGGSDIDLIGDLNCHDCVIELLGRRPFGMNVQLTKDWALLPMNDGRKSHLMLTYSQPKFSVSLMYIWFKHPGISISTGF